MKKVAVCIMTLIVTVGCLSPQPVVQPTVQPPITQPVVNIPTTDTTQYDYGAGYPNQYPTQQLDSIIPPSNDNQYLHQNDTVEIPQPIPSNIQQTWFIPSWYVYPETPKKKPINLYQGTILFEFE